MREQPCRSCTGWTIQPSSFPRCLVVPQQKGKQTPRIRFSVLRGITTNCLFFSTSAACVWEASVLSHHPQMQTKSKQVKMSMWTIWGMQCLWLRCCTIQAWASPTGACSTAYSLVVTGNPSPSPSGCTGPSIGKLFSTSIFILECCGTVLVCCSKLQS